MSKLRIKTIKDEFLTAMVVECLVKHRDTLPEPRERPNPTRVIHSKAEALRLIMESAK